MTYDDMPPGTVLRDPATNGVYVRLGSEGDLSDWRVLFTSSLFGVYDVTSLPDGLVELVEKPATPPKLWDAEGDLWTPVEAAPLRYRVNGSHVERSRSEIEAQWGPLTEEPL